MPEVVDHLAGVAGERRPGDDAADRRGRVGLLGGQAARGERSAEWLPAIAPLPAASAPIPVPPVPLVDRERELDRIADLLSDPMCRLITIVGVGGIGKTHLALEAAQREAQRVRAGLAGTHSHTSAICRSSFFRCAFVSVAAFSLASAAWRRA